MCIGELAITPALQQLPLLLVILGENLGFRRISGIPCKLAEPEAPTVAGRFGCEAEWKRSERASTGPHLHDDGLGGLLGDVLRQLGWVLEGVVQHDGVSDADVLQRLMAATRQTMLVRPWPQVPRVRPLPPRKFALMTKVSVDEAK